MLEHGIPPTCGFGFGERLFAFMVDKPIRETQLFPLMRPKEEGSKKDKETMIAIAIINRGANLAAWQVLNTVAHLNAALGARVGKQELFTRDTIFSKDNVSIKLNPKIAIMLKVADTSEEIAKLSNFAKEKEFEVEDFIREMIETTNDKKIFDSVASKNASEVEYLGTLIYGAKKKVEELTKDFELYK
jgi:lysyl-tRNA synthetase class 2